MRRFLFIWMIAGMIAAFWGSALSAEDAPAAEEAQDEETGLSLLHVDVHVLPPGCTDPIHCIADGSPMMSNILALTPEGRSALTQALSARSVITGLTPDSRAALCARQMRPVLHDTPIAPALDALTNHPGVYFDGASLEAAPESEGFSEIVRDLLPRMGMRLLTKEEWQAMPGRPKLTVTFMPESGSGACYSPFSVSMTITEEVVLVRDPRIKTSTTVYSANAQQRVANLNYTPIKALDALLQRFMAEFTAANPS